MHPFDDHPRAIRDRIYGDSTSGRDGRQALAVAAFALSVLFLVAFLSAAQVTSPGPARDILESGVVITTELDQVIAEDHEALRDLVQASSANTFSIPDYPLDIVLTRDEILNSSDAELRDLVLERSSGLVYAKGLDAFDRTGSQSFSRFSSQGLLELSVGQISQDTHDKSRLLAIVFVVVTAITAGFVLLTGHGWGRLRNLGLGTLIAALPGLLFCGLAWLAADRAGGSEPFVDGLRDVIRTTIDVPLRNYLVVLILGATLTVIALVFSAAERRMDIPEFAEAEDDY